MSCLFRILVQRFHACPKVFQSAAPFTSLQSSRRHWGRPASLYHLSGSNLTSYFFHDWCKQMSKSVTPTLNRFWNKQRFKKPFFLNFSCEDIAIDGPFSDRIENCSLNYREVCKNVNYFFTNLKLSSKYIEFFSGLLIVALL